VDSAPKQPGQSQNPDKDWALSSAVQGLETLIAEVKGFQVPEGLPRLATAQLQEKLGQIQSGSTGLLREIDPKNAIFVTE
jgi:hypothetical protein